MTNRSFIKCKVCNSVIMVRTQVGWLPEHPIRIHCAKCGILISGKCIQDQKNTKLRILFENAIEVHIDQAIPDYYIEVSGELLTFKIRAFNHGIDEYQPPAFFNTLQSMKDEQNSFKKFEDNILKFMCFIKQDWPFIRCIHELWLSKKYGYLPSQMKNYLPIDFSLFNNEFECLKGIHELFISNFNPILPTDFNNTITKSIEENILDINKSNPEEYKKLTEYFFDNGLLDNYENRILEILNSFIEKYNFFITVTGLEYYKEQPDLINIGTTTVSFEDVKHFYLDCFETIGEIISLIVAYNNLKYRNNFMYMLPTSEFPKIITFQNYIEIHNKGNKIKFCETDEIFNKIIGFDSGNRIRNAIGHGSYSYDGINQEISYYSSGKHEKGEKEQIYLVDFIQKTWTQFQTLTILIEIIYQTRKAYYSQHDVISIHSVNLDKQNKGEIGRNEPCPCGSGKKYKKCCGGV